MNKIIKNLIIFLIFLFIAFFSFRYLLNGIIGMRHDWVLPYFSDQINIYLSNESFIWSDIYSVGFLRRNLLYFNFFLGIIANLTGYNPIIFSTLSVTSLMSLSGFSMYLFAKKFSNTEFGGIIAGLFYMLTPAVFNTFIAGYTGFIFSYALTPLILLLFFEGINDLQVNWVKIILASLLFGFSFAQQQFIFFIPSIILLWIIINYFNENKINFGHLKAFFSLIIIGLIMHIFWILPSYIATNVDINRLSSLGYHALQNSPEIWQSVIMTGWLHDYDYSNLILYDKISSFVLIFLYILISLSLTSLLYKKNRGKKIFLTILFLIGIFFGTGLNNPGGVIYELFFTNISIFRVFRDPYYFSFFVAFSVSILLSFLVKDLFKISKNYFQNQKTIKTIIICTLIIIIFISSYPLLTGNFAGQIQNINLPGDYKTVYQEISNDGDICRVLYLPSFQPIKIEENEFSGVDPIIHFSPKPTFPQYVDTTDRLNRFHEYTILSLRNSNNIENFINITSTKYIVEREKFESWYWKFIPGDIGIWKKNDYSENSLPGEIIYESENISLYKRNYSNFFRINRPIIGFGNLNLINCLPSNIIDNFCIIFNSDIYNEFDNFQEFPYITNDVNGFENPVILMNNYENILRFKTDQLEPFNGWSYDINTWRQNQMLTADQFIDGIDSVQTSKVNAKIYGNFSVKNEDSYYIFLRFYKNINGGRIKIYIDGEKKIYNTKDKLNYFDYERIGLFNLEKGKHEIIIENIEGFNSISYVSYFSSNEYSNSISNYHKTMSNNELLYIFDVKNNFYTLNNNENDRDSSYQALNLESVGEAWREIKIDKNDDFIIGVKGIGEYDIYVDDNLYEFSSDVLNYIYFGPCELSEGIHNFSVRSYKNSNIINEHFENVISNWTSGSIAFTKEFSKDSFNGDYSLKISTNSNKTYTWSWIRSIPIQVEAGIKCRISNYMKYENVKQSHIAIEGYNISSDTWQQLIQVPSGSDGSSDWKEYEIIFEIPDNITEIRSVLNAGWVLDESKGAANTWFDEISIYPYNEGYVDDICIFPSSLGNNLNDLFDQDNEIQIRDSKKISPTCYELVINSTGPFMLSFSESFNDQWIAEVNNNGMSSNYYPIPLYGTINGYWINETGVLNIKIYYEPQQWMDRGLIISLGCVFICLTYILYNSRFYFIDMVGKWKNDKK